MDQKVDLDLNMDTGPNLDSGHAPEYVHVSGPGCVPYSGPELGFINRPEGRPGCGYGPKSTLKPLSGLPSCIHVNHVFIIDTEAWANVKPLEMFQCLGLCGVGSAG